MDWAKVTSLLAMTACSGFILQGCIVQGSVQTSVEDSPQGWDGAAESCSPTHTTDLWFGLVTHTAAGPQQNAFDQPLYTGDRIALIVHAPDPMYLYVLNAPDGEDPRLIHEPTAATHGTVRIPEQGWFELAPPAGHELLALVATRDPIDLDGAGGYWLIEEVANATTKSDLTHIQSAKPPDFTEDGYASIGVRGEGLKLRGNGSVSLDPRGHDEVVVLVDIDHRPR